MKKLTMLALSFVLLFQLLLLPGKALAAAPSFVSLSQNMLFGYALDSNGHIWAWGDNSFGAYGDGTTITINSNVMKRVEVMDSGSPVTFQDVKAGVEHGMALDTDGRIWTTGKDNNHQLGNGSALGEVHSWTKISAMDGGNEVVFKQIAAMRYTSYALDENGKIWVFGNYTRVLSEGSEVPIPVTKDGVDAETFQQIDGKYDYLLGIDTAGYLWGIDRNSYLDPFKYTTTDSGGTDVLFQSVSSGYNHMNTALDEDGQVWIWGHYEAGQLGDGGATNAIRYDPKLLPVTDGGTPVVFADISPSVAHVLALDEHGYLWAWGSNDNGKFGNGSTVDSNVPIKVTDAGGSPVQFTSVEVGFFESYGIDSGGRIWTWGSGRLVPQLKKFSAAVGLTVSPASSSSYLQSVTLTATVGGDGDTPTGTVVFKDGSTILGSRTLTGGTASWTTTSLSAATHSLKAEYSGDEFYAAAISAAMSYQVTMPDAPDLTLTHSPTADTFDPVTVSVAVNINGSGNSLDQLKWLAGNQNASAFGGSGTDIKAAGEFDAEDNGIYTVYARDAAGNETVKTIEIDNILEAGNAAALNTAITNANQALTDHEEGTGVGDAPASARSTLQTAIDAAQSVYDDRTNRTQSQLDTATSTLESAISAFEAAVIGAGNATALNTAITDANQALTDHEEGTGVGDAPASARSTLQTAIDTAQSVYDDRTNRTQSQLDTATSTLESAISAFEAAVIGAGNAAALNTAITNANQALTDHEEGTGVGDAPASARSTLQTAIDAAQSV
ncbi:Ig-like domain repeat protein, partial [Paenibacillus sp. HB172176]|uniref:Ig-like domain repeat protein n=1 Tax=Paenibacillus sp. HB172176 TaxID=2493690 RepID=UPI00143C6FE1